MQNVTIGRHARHRALQPVAGRAKQEWTTPWRDRFRFTALAMDRPDPAAQRRQSTEGFNEPGLNRPGRRVITYKRCSRVRAGPYHRRLPHPARWASVNPALKARRGAPAPLAVDGFLNDL
jgi:hypothetical protein